MKSTISLIAFGASLALASAAAFAQSAPPTEHQMHDNTQTQEKVAQGDDSVTHRQKGYFRSLDRGAKGYLNTDDVSADPFLSQNFGKCDNDHDGKLMLTEFLVCTHNNPTQQ